MTMFVRVCVREKERKKEKERERVLVSAFWEQSAKPFMTQWKLNGP